MEFDGKKDFEESPCDIPLTWCRQSERHSQRFLLPFWSFAILWKLRSLVILRDPLYRKLDESFESPRCFKNWWKFYGIQGNTMLKVLRNQLRTFQYPMLPEKCPTLPLLGGNKIVCGNKRVCGKPLLFDFAYYQARQHSMVRNHIDRGPETPMNNRTCFLTFVWKSKTYSRMCSLISDHCEAGVGSSAKEVLSALKRF